jgi:cytochrome c-type biogenesis protein CcmH/NrfG
MRHRRRRVKGVRETSDENYERKWQEHNQAKRVKSKNHGDADKSRATVTRMDIPIGKTEEKRQGKWVWRKRDIIMAIFEITTSYYHYPSYTCIFYIQSDGNHRFKSPSAVPKLE